MAGVSRTEFRNAMARVCTPVNIVTTNGPAGRGGFTATAMCSVTDEPPTLLVCMNGRSAQAQLFLANKRFCVNVLTPEHRDLANLFASGSADMGARYVAASWITMAGGTEAPADAIVSFDCTLEDVQRVGTHHVFIGRVESLRARTDGNALAYFDRNYVQVPSLLAS